MPDYIDWGWGDVPNDYWASATNAETKITSLTNAKNTALSTGNQNWAKIVGYVLNYGEKALTILTNTGVIKNKNLDQVTNLKNIDQTAMEEFLARFKNPNLESGDTPTEDPTRSSSILGVPTSYVVVALFVGVVWYMFFKDKDKDQKKKS